MVIPSSYIFTLRNISSSPLFASLPRHYFPPSFDFPILQDEEEENWWRKEKGEEINEEEEGGIKGIIKQPFFGLVLLLMYEKVNKNSSKWQKMIELMPKKYEAIHQWEDEDLKFLENTSYPPSEIKANSSLLTSVYSSIFIPSMQMWPDLFDISNYPIELFHWAVSSIWSRGFWIDDFDRYPALIPLSDMFNHFTLSSSPLIADYRLEGEKWIVKTFRRYKEGEQVWISYGNKANAEWLNDYGFVYEMNDRNAFRCSLPPVVISPLSSLQLNCQKNYLLSSKRLLSSAYYIEKDKLPHDLLTSLRIRLFDHIDLYHASGQEVDENGEVEFTSQISLSQIDEGMDIREGISYRNEFLVYEYIINQFNSVYQSLILSAEEDDREYQRLSEREFNLLTAPEQRKFFGLRYRREEKILLEHLIAQYTPTYEKLKRIDENRRNNVIIL